MFLASVCGWCGNNFQQRQEHPAVAWYFQGLVRMVRNDYSPWQVTFGMLKIDGRYEQYEPALFPGPWKNTNCRNWFFVHLPRQTLQLRNEEKKKRRSNCWPGWRSCSKSRPICQFVLKWHCSSWRGSFIRIWLTTWRNMRLEQPGSDRILTLNSVRMFAIGSVCRHLPAWRRCSHSRKPSVDLASLLLKKSVKSWKLKEDSNWKNSDNKEFHQIWQDTTNLNAFLDRIVCDNETIQGATRELNSSFTASAENHFFSLEVQGALTKVIIDNICRKNIILWNTVMNNLPQILFRFTRKALLQVLPTNCNLAKWKSAANPTCGLCGGPSQTNKHVSGELSSGPRAVQGTAQQHTADDCQLDTWRQAWR